MLRRAQIACQTPWYSATRCARDAGPQTWSDDLQHLHPLWQAAAAVALRVTQRGGVGTMVLPVCESVVSALSGGQVAPRGNWPDGEGRGEEDAGICKG